MKTVFKSSFAKDLKAIKSKPVLDAIAKLIELVETAPTLRDSRRQKTQGKGQLLSDQAW